jgi:hypothetical protein
MKISRLNDKKSFIDLIVHNGDEITQVTRMISEPHDPARTRRKKGEEAKPEKKTMIKGEMQKDMEEIMPP